MVDFWLDGDGRGPLACNERCDPPQPLRIAIVALIFVVPAFGSLVSERSPTLGLAESVAQTDPARLSGYFPASASISPKSTRGTSARHAYSSIFLFTRSSSGFFTGLRAGRSRSDMPTCS